jgi:hypothetical protein
MCNCHANYQDFALVRRLRDRGIPVDEYEFARMQAACAGLVILEDAGLPSTVFDLSSGGAGYRLSVVISNQSKRPLAPAHIGFEGPDWATGMSLLPDPHKEYPARRGNAHRRVRDNGGCVVDYSSARNFYVFPTQTPMVDPRNEVLNHRLGRGRFLYPGESWEGCLLAVGQQSIPSEYRDRDRLKMRLTLFDQRGHFHKATFHPIVQRSRQDERRLAEFVSRDETCIRDKPAAAAARLRDDVKPNLGQEEDVDPNCVSAAAGGSSKKGVLSQRGVSDVA